MMRNTVLVYFGFGLILAPEIFSSKLKKEWLINKSIIFDDWD
jgi:hypothetical protein